MEWGQLFVWGIFGLILLGCVWYFVVGALLHTEEKERKLFERDLRRGTKEVVNEPDGGEWAERMARERLELIQEARRQAGSK